MLPLRLSTPDNERDFLDAATPTVGTMRGEKTATRACPLLATTDQALIESVSALGVALGVEPTVASVSEEARRLWSTASLRLVGVDMAARAAHFTRLDATYVVGSSPSELLEASARLRLPALLLPGASDELAALLTAHVAGSVTARTIEVIGASGGVGVSTLVGGLAVAAVAAGHRSAAVELAQCGGGLDLLFGAETTQGLRWADLAGAEGHLGPLDDHLVVASGVSVVALDRTQPVQPAWPAVTAVLAALALTHEVVVVDAGWCPQLTNRAGPSEQVLVVAADVAGVAAARMRVDTDDLAAARLVVRRGSGRMLPAEAVAEALGMELLGVVRQDAAVARLASFGGSVASGTARRFGRDARRIWAALVP